MRHEVERANSTRLAALQSPPVSYDARDSGSATPERRKAVLAGMMVPERLVLKRGAQVMLVKNVDDQRGLVNGAVGRVLGFFAAPRGKSEGVVRNVSLSEDGKSIAFGGDMKENVKPASSSSSTKMESERGKEKPKSAVAAAADAELFPLVDFMTPMGRERVLVTRDEFRVEDNEGTILARRVQVSTYLSLPRLVVVLILRAPRAQLGSSHPRMGPVHPQEPGPDPAARQGRSRPGVREGPELRRAVSGGDDGGSASLAVRSQEGASSTVHVPHSLSLTLGFYYSCPILGMCASEGHRMEQVAGESHDMTLYDTTSRRTHYTCIV